MKSLILISSLASLLIGRAAAAPTEAHFNASGWIDSQTCSSFENAGWVSGADSSVSGAISISEDHPPVPNIQHSQLIEPDFQGTFAGLMAAPTGDLFIPGDAKKVTLWLKVSDPAFGVAEELIELTTEAQRHRERHRTKTE